ncbi:MAG: leucine-rich repeat domain-containing protein [Oscillospiraceae bacterium]|nr:leucine-rich repeat domain-containing protein [Oscillospiraceae bacterium]
MKKFLAAFLCAAMALSLSACNENTETPDDDKDKSSVSDSKKDNDNSKDNSLENSEPEDSSVESKPEEIGIPDESDFAEPDKSEFVWGVGENGILIVGYTGNETAIKIPSEIDGHTVSYIEYSQGVTWANVEHVIFPDTVTVIDNRAFENSALKSINIPDSVVRIGRGAFEGTAYLKNKLAGAAYFIDNGKLYFPTSELSGDVVIPDGVTMIGDYAFSGSAIESVVIPDGCISICAAFNNCPNLKSVELPDSVEFISIGAFYDCESLESINLPDNVRIPFYELYGGGIGGGLFDRSYNINITYRGNTYDSSHIDDLYNLIYENNR